MEERTRNDILTSPHPLPHIPLRAGLAIAGVKKEEARLSTLNKFKHGLLKIDSKYVPTTGNQKKSHRQTNSCSLDVPSYRTQY